jgi:hypothetical protein
VDDTRGSDAVDRAREAAERAEELEERLRRLRSGEPVTHDDVHRAELAAEEERERSVEAHRLAREGYRRSAQRHRDAAEVFEAGGHLDRAAEHRHLAQADEDSANRQSNSMPEPQD